MSETLKSNLEWEREPWLFPPNDVEEALMRIRDQRDADRKRYFANRVRERRERLKEVINRV